MFRMYRLNLYFPHLSLFLRLGALENHYQQNHQVIPLNLLNQYSILDRRILVHLYSRYRLHIALTSFLVCGYLISDIRYINFHFFQKMKNYVKGLIKTRKWVSLNFTLI